MPSINSISMIRLSRLIGMPGCPALFDVRIQGDFTADRRLIPGAVRRDHAHVSDWARDQAGRPAVVFCQHGHQLSQGVAAWLRHEGAVAEVLEGGFEAWAKAGLPLVPEAKLPPRDAQGRIVWVTRSRPKVDRIACPWLVRRFVDPFAVILFVAPSEVAAVAERFGGVPFDIEGVFWTHRGERCTFDTIIEELGLSTEPLQKLAAIVRGRYRTARSCARGVGTPGGLARSLPTLRRRSRAARRRHDAL